VTYAFVGYGVEIVIRIDEFLFEGIKGPMIVTFRRIGTCGCDDERFVFCGDLSWLP
jgi:hypothetical protein